MKTVFIIGSKLSGEKNNPHLLGEKLQAQLEGCIVRTVYWEDVVFHISSSSQQVTDQASGKDFKTADLLIAVNWYRSGRESVYRDVAFTLGLYLDHHHREFWNREMVMQRSTTKLSTMMQLALAGYDIPTTNFSLQASNLFVQQLTYPLIAKAVAASRGRHNYLVHSEEELQAKLQELGEPNQLLIQEFIPNDGDVRVVCFDGKPEVIIRRSRSPDAATHLNNTSQGGTAELGTVEDALSTEQYEACRQVCKIMGRELAGIDFVVANDGSSRQVFLEVNAIPQLTSGAFVEKKLTLLADTLRNKLME